MENIEIIKRIRENHAIINSDDSELAELATEENDQLLSELDLSDSDDHLPAIVEIRAGTGGDEAELFAGDLYRMYIRFANNNQLKVTDLDSDFNQIGGLKFAELEIKGKLAYQKFKYEAGVHRVQRVPKTEKSGRVHTSAATVAVFPLKTRSDIEIRSEDLRVDVYRSSGKGGQGVNTTDSAVRITHIPTNTVVTCQDERSQMKNKAKAMQVLSSRLEAKAQEEAHGSQTDARRDMVKSGDRSDKIRTYNFPQDRITDHRIEKSFAQIEKVLNGALEPIIEGLLANEHEQKLANILKPNPTTE